MAERQMAGVVTQRGHPQHAAPVLMLGAAVLGDHIAHGVAHLVGPGHHVEDPPGDLHHAERVLEALMRGAWVDQVRQRQLMDLAQTLEGTRVDDRALRVFKVDEDMHGVAHLVVAFRHHRSQPPGAAGTARTARSASTRHRALWSNICSHHRMVATIPDGTPLAAASGVARPAVLRCMRTVATRNSASTRRRSAAFCRTGCR